MADSGEKRMNLAALQRVDPCVSNILAMASQVALYKFNGTTNEWEKTEVEGTLFVYRRCAKPFYGFIIMNRLNRNNLVEPLTTEMEFQRQDPFLLYKNSKTVIYGIWFYDKDDCSQIDNVMNKLMDIMMNKKETNNSNQSQHLSNEAKTVDIVSMLTKAQNEYNQTKGGDRRSSEPKNISDNPINLTEIVRPRAVRATNSSGPPPDLTSGTGSRSPEVEGTSLSVAALFASASGVQDTRNNNNLDVICKHHLPPSKTIDNQSFGGKLEWTPGGGDGVTPGEQSLHAVLQKLISNSQQSPEKDSQKEPVRKSSLTDDFFRQFQIHSKESENEPTGQSIVIKNSPSNVLTPAMLEKSFGPSPVSCDLASNFLSATPPKTLPFASASGMLNASLMSPMMFTSPKIPPPTDHVATPQITPLTKEQLVQAMIYLLQNDQEVVTKLHEAYVKSLTAFASGHIKS